MKLSSFGRADIFLNLVVEVYAIHLRIVESNRHEEVNGNSCPIYIPGKYRCIPHLGQFRGMYHQCMKTVVS